MFARIIRRRVAASVRQYAGIIFAVLVALVAGAPIAAAEENAVAVELNKLENKESGCRAFFLIDNKSDKAYEKFQIEFFVFRPDGIIDQSFAVDLAPLKAEKRTVKRFDIANTACDQVGSFLVNDVTKCEAGSEALSDCLERLTVSSRTDSALSK